MRYFTIVFWILAVLFFKLKRRSISTYILSYNEELKQENQNTKARVTIIIPFYNKGHFVDRLLGSLFRQEYMSFNVLFIDDKSTEEHHNMLINKTKKYPFIKVITNEKNEGQHVTKMRGIKECNTELITFLDGDDEMYDSALKNLINTYDNTSADIIGGNMLYYRKKAWIDFWWKKPNFKEKMGNDLLNSSLKKEFNWILCTRLFKTELWKKAINLMGKYANYRLDDYEDRLEFGVYLLFANKFVQKDFYTLKYYYDMPGNSHNSKKCKHQRKVGNMKRKFIDRVLNELYHSYFINQSIKDSPFSLPKNIEDEILPEQYRFVRW